ncbi:MAG: hypothetical protein KF903_12760 [Dokdonella sp.]|uniref:hypothetical protein n=1 Tax=Dokdonella sp. TaxID=2291710 RepID=UPI0025BC4A8C|nr:hypothetical protein [Dokdonella sp.]MBX3701854.1 hypothetical protein [Dokdonella sp.]
MKHSSTWPAAAMLALACVAASSTFALAANTDPDSVVAPAATQWRMTPGVTFVPRSSDMSVTYVGAGCVTAPVGTGLAHKVVLGDGMTARFVRLYYRHDPSVRLLFALTRYDAQGAFTDYGTTYSTSAAGYTSILSPELAHVVDAANYGYVVNVQFWNNPDAIFANGFENPQPPLFCGVRLMWDE